MGLAHGLSDGGAELFGRSVEDGKKLGAGSQTSRSRKAGSYTKPEKDRAQNLLSWRDSDPAPEYTVGVTFAIGKQATGLFNRGFMNRTCGRVSTRRWITWGATRRTMRFPIGSRQPFFRIGQTR